MAASYALRRRLGRSLFLGVVALIYLFLMLPIAVVVLASVNSGAYLRFPPEGFSLRWYAAFFDSQPFISAMLLSLRVAAISTVFATLFGTMAAVYHTRFARRGRGALRMALIAPMLLPEILTAIALLLYYYAVGLGTQSLLGLQIGHVLARAIAADGVAAIGVCAVFSPLNANQEREAGQILREECPDASITLSHELGRIGLLARENVTLLNAALTAMARHTVAAFLEAMAQTGITAPLFITQNDGTVVASDEAAKFPVRSFASGPTNSLRGAAFLSGLQDALVVDVGGTTADIGSLVRGFPREANNVVQVGGVRTLFRMPDLLSIGLGGGTLCDPGDPSRIGPRSVGFRLPQQARVFGGPDLTCTDVAVAAGLIDLGDRSCVASLSPEYVQAALARMHAMLADAVDRMKGDARPVPLVAVGGGAFLVPDRLPGISEVIRVPHAGVANALGAAIAQVSGEVDQIFTGMSREDAMATARGRAEASAVRAGALAGSLTLVDMEDIPLAYLPGGSLRVRARVVGEVPA